MHMAKLVFRLKIGAETNIKFTIGIVNDKRANIQIRSLNKPLCYENLDLSWNFDC